MGFHIGRLICASNENKVLYDFFRTGVYDRNREFILTSSPSMDILISSNLERLIYRIAGDDAKENARLMAELSSKGSYKVSDSMKKEMQDFKGGFATMAEVSAEIAKLYAKTGYVLDTHTAVASCVYRAYREESGDQTPTVIASTASPYKFARSVMEAIDSNCAGMDDFALIDELSRISGTRVPWAIEEIRSAEVLHDKVIDKTQMEAAVREFLGIR